LTGGRLPSRPFLYPVLDVQRLAGRSIEEAVAQLARGGSRIVQLRAKSVTDSDFLDLARRARAATRFAGVLFLVNDRPDIARIVDADGVHLGQDDLSPREARTVLAADSIVGLSTHDLEQASAADGEPVDYVAFGPVFPTSSKERPDPVVGLEGLRRARQVVHRPLVAIGGLSRLNVRQAVEAGADGLAVVSELLSAADLASAAAEFRSAFGGAA
jgi:thiamine-phosphate pyrophosphorylase